MDSVAELVERTTGRSADPAVVEALQKQTGGNPFFLAQVLPALTKQGGWNGEPSGLLLPRHWRSMSTLPAR